jgi:hypothetical protein
MRNKKEKQKEKIQIEFEKEHLYVLISALETYSRLQSGQIATALDNVYFDRDLTGKEKEHIQRIIRYYAFPQAARREHDGNGGFYDQYDNEYGENGEIINESELWKRLKSRPHLDHPNSSFGVGCKEMKQGTIAFEIRKVIDQYFHYERNDGYRSVCDVSGDGMPHSISGIITPKILNFKPEKSFKIAKKYSKTLEQEIESKNWENVWYYIDNTVFPKKSLPRGSRSKIEKKGENWFVIVEEPYKK